MRRLWELIILLVIAGMLLQSLMQMIGPLLPYIAGALVVAVTGFIGFTIYRSTRNW